MTWDTLQQVIRIVLYSVGGYFLGDGVVDSEVYQAAIGGVLAVGAFVWWFFWERNRSGTSTI